MLRSHFGEYRFFLYVTLIGLAALGGCAPIAGPGQVATRANPPPGKTAAAVQSEDALCKRAANGDTRTYVRCMEQRGYRVDLFGPGGIPMTIAQLPLPSSPAAPSPSPTIPPANESAGVSQQEEMACKQYAAGSAGVYAECIRKRAFGPGGRVTDVSPDSLNADEFQCHRYTAMASGIPTPILTGSLTNTQRSIYVRCMSERGYSVAGLPGAHRYVADGQPTDFGSSYPVDRPPPSQAEITPPVVGPDHAPSQAAPSGTRGRLLTNEEEEKLGGIVEDELVKAGFLCAVFDSDKFLKCVALHAVPATIFEIKREKMTANIIYTVVCGDHGFITSLMPAVRAKLSNTIAIKMVGIEHAVSEYVRCSA
jgi:hypothetical protein